MSNQAGKMYPMRHVVVLVATQLLLLLLSPRASQCLELDSSSSSRHHSPQLDKSGWQTIEVGSATNEHHHLNQQEPQTDNDEPQNVSVLSRYKKLIEWDDDENNSNGNSLGGSSLILPYEDAQRQPEPLKKQPALETLNDKLNNLKWPKKSGKLVFHGTLKNSTSRTVDGLKLHINTHRPVPIARFEQKHRHRIVGRNMMLMREQPEVVSSQDVDEITSRQFSQPTTEMPTSTKRPTLTKKNKLLQIGGHNSLHSPTTEPTAFSYSISTNSDWRPLVMSFTPAASNRRRSFVKTERVRKQAQSSKQEADESKIVADTKWRPISITKRADTKRDGLLAGQQVHHKSTIEEPFDDENILIEHTSTPQTTVRESKSLSQKTQDSRWTPVDTTTTTSLPDTTELVTATSSPIATSTILPTINYSTNKSSSTKQNSSESTQLRSASDLNYIYSSQPNASPAAPIDWPARVQTATSTGYYATNSYQQQQQPITSTLVDQQPTFPAGAIVDTTSGQTPETIDSRSEPQVQQTDFSLPLASATFQPAQAPPIRTQALPGAYGNGYDNSAYYYSAAPVTQPQRQVVATPSPPPNQFVRQEHHYHYYNNNNQQRQQQPAVANNLIREIQPVVISQPYIQPAPSPTPSPQIIREIIKEVPIQTVQLQPVQVPRIIVPPPAPQRELEPSYYPAQRIIRQISGSIPSVGVRQIRLPLPTIQLPVRLAAAPAPSPVTRQTGSYIIPPMPQKTTTYLTETQAMPTHTTIMHTTQFTPATRTTVYTTDHQPPPVAQAQPQTLAASTGYKRR